MEFRSSIAKLLRLWVCVALVVSNTAGVFAYDAATGNTPDRAETVMRNDCLAANSFLEWVKGKMVSAFSSRAKKNVSWDPSLQWIPAKKRGFPQAPKKTDRVHRVAVNGAGRIGRLLVREMIDESNPNLNIVAIVGADTSRAVKKDLSEEENRKRREMAQMAYARATAKLLNHDSAHGKWKDHHAEAVVEDGRVYLVIDGEHRIEMIDRKKNPADLPWKKMDIDIVAETSGKHKKAADAKKHLEAGAKRIVIGAPGKGLDGTYVYNVNSGRYDPSQRMISNASCTTNSVSPVVKALKPFGLQAGTIVTTHSQTASQVTLDRVKADNPSRGKAAAFNIIDTTTGVAKALPEVDPVSLGKFTAKALRVPTQNVSINTLVFKFDKKVSPQDIEAALGEAQEGPLKGTLKVEEIKFSGKMMTRRVTSVAVPSSITVIDTPDGGTLVGMQVWYDNEAGFTDQYIRLMEHVAMAEEGKVAPEIDVETEIDANPAAREMVPEKSIEDLASEIEATDVREDAVPKKPLRLAVNGAGRISLAVLRRIIGDPRFNLVAVAYHDIESLVDRLTWDSVHGKLDADVEMGDGFIKINGKRIDIVPSAEDAGKLGKLPWKDYDVDIAIDATGVFKTRKELEGHLRAGAKRVVLSVPFGDKDDDIQLKTFVPGVNDEKYDGEDVLSAGSCTTNALTPGMKPLQRLGKVLGGRFVTVHAATSSQVVIDKRVSKAERSRATKNTILTSTGAAKTAGYVMPELKGKLQGDALRVDTLDGSVIEASLVVEGELTPDRINREFLRASKNELKGILKVEEDVWASTDIVGEPATSILSADATRVIPLPNGQSLVKLTLWYDNEIGYTDQMMRLAAKVGADMQADLERDPPLVVKGVGELPTLRDVAVKDKRVVNRVDFNVQVDVDTDAEGNVIEDSIRITDSNRIRKELPTLLKLLEDGAKYVTLVTHFEPKIQFKGEDKPRKVGLSTHVIAEKIRELCAADPELAPYADKVAFLAGSVDKKKGVTVSRDDLDRMAAQNGTRVFVMENIRLHPGEKKGDAVLRDQLCGLADVYVNEAFAAFHRAHASMMPEGVEKAVGGLVEHEIGNLSKAFNPRRPMVAIFGGAKVEDKVGVLNNFLETMQKGDKILICGAMAYTFLKARNPDLPLGKSYVEDQDKIDLARKIIARFEAKGIEYVLPEDHVVTRELSPEGKKKAQTTKDASVPDGLMAVDIGQKTVERFLEALDGAETVVWNGPAGVFEKKKGGFIEGFKAVAEAVDAMADRGADVLLGGGETVAAFKQSGIDLETSKVFASTAGGASFEFLSTKGNMPVIRNLSLSIPETPRKIIRAPKKTDRVHNIAVNGAGRIGRLLVREIIEENNPNLNIAAIVGTDTSKAVDKKLSEEENRERRVKAQLAYAKVTARLIMNDSMHGKWRGHRVRAVREGDKVYLLVDEEHKIEMVERFADPADLPWKQLNIDIVAETSGNHKESKNAKKHLEAGAKRIVVGAPGKGLDGTYVYNVNSGRYDPAQKMISNASCTTNSVAPVVTALKPFGLLAGTIVTTHSQTASQVTLDRVKPDRPARGKAASVNIIDTTTGVAKALPEVDPVALGKFTAKALRVPTGNVSVNTLVFELNEDVSKEDILRAFQDISQDSLKGTLAVRDIKVSGMMMSERVTSIVVPSSITTFKTGEGKTLVGMQVWYDNEAGFTDQFIRMMEHVAMADEGKMEPESGETQFEDFNPRAKELKPAKSIDELPAASEEAAPREETVVDQPIRLALNGAGRISLAVIRQIVGDSRFDLRAIAYHDIESLVDRLEFDTVHGEFEEDIQIGDDFIVINGKRIDIVESAPGAKRLKDLPWKEYDVDVVIDATGKFKKYSELKGHLEAGAKKVILSVPFGDKDDDIQVKTFVPGVNSGQYRGEDVLSAGSCTTNALTPGMKPFETLGAVLGGRFVTVHAVTASQVVIDKRVSKAERSRATKNTILTSTGAAKTAGYVMPQLKGKLQGDALRVDTLDGSVVEETLVIDGTITPDQVNDAFLRASRNELYGILSVRDMVDASSEIVGERTTTILSADATRVIPLPGGRSMVKLTLWYDNEMGYTDQMLRLAAQVGTEVQKADSVRPVKTEALMRAA
jgi:glyceraldehyde-3-phosphate dehydrogenase type I